MSMITLLVTSENAACEKRFDRTQSVASLKQRLEVLTGFSVATMKVEVFNKLDQLVAIMDNDQFPMTAYPMEDFFRLNVVSNDPFRIKNEFSDVSRVEKYEMADNEYDKRNDSVRSYLQRNKLGKYAEKTAAELYDYKKESEGVKVGDRCEITMEEGGLARRGEAKFKHGYWVGVEYDEPLGKHDGSVDGERYFQCLKNHGGFLRPDKVKVGDYPEEDFSDLEEM